MDKLLQVVKSSGDDFQIQVGTYMYSYYLIYLFVHIFLEMSSYIINIVNLSARGSSCGKETRKDMLVVSILYIY